MARARRGSAKAATATRTPKQGGVLTLKKNAAYFDLAKAKALVAEVKKDYDLSCWGFNVYEDDPFISLNQNLHSKSAGNWIGYNNPEVDKLFDQAVAAKSDAERKTALDGIAVTVSDYAVFDKAWILPVLVLAPGLREDGEMGILRSRRGAVEVLVIDRPEKRNALDPATICAIGETFLEIEHDDEVAVLVITGAGDRAFCAGMDLASFADGRQRLAGVAAERYEEFFRTGLTKPVVAALNGSAVGGGFELMLACDVSVAADHAMLGIPEVKRGLFAGAGGTLLPTRVPAAVALEMGLTGDLITAARAYELGLVNRVVPGVAVLSEALALAERIAANAPLAVRVTKRLMYDALESPVSAAWSHVMEALPGILGTSDALEGSRAFVEKRTPRWSGI